MNRFIFVFPLWLIFSPVIAQTKPPVPVTFVREADIMWAKDIWRVIDVSDKFNFPFYFPLDTRVNQKNLFQVLVSGISDKTIVAYDTDELNTEDTLSSDKLSERIVFSDSIAVYSADEFGSEIIKKEWKTDTLSGEYIIQYWLKEQWFFDKQRSVMDVRIVAICPVKIDLEKEALVPLFWVDYQKAREQLNSYKAINSKNEAEQRSFDELFMKRKFTSTIKKESNIYDREIFDYVETDQQAMKESERIKEYLRNFECDRWEY